MNVWSVLFCRAQARCTPISRGVFTTGRIFPATPGIQNCHAIVEIDAKHSNEDAIAPFSRWLHAYGRRIGNFGGIDTDILCQKQEQEIRAYVRKTFAAAAGCGGVALGSGNSIPDYVPAAGYLAMIENERLSRLLLRPVPETDPRLWI